MSKQTINNVISLEIPDSFQLMSSEELRDMSKNGGDPYRWGVRDRENHVLITVMWKQYSAILAWLADLKAIAKKNEQMTRKAYGKHEYRLLGFDSLKAGESGGLSLFLQCRRHPTDCNELSDQERENGLRLYVHRAGGKHGHGSGNVPQCHGKPSFYVNISHP